MGEREGYTTVNKAKTYLMEFHMRNGQLKPGYNVQFVVNSEYVTGI